MLHYQTIETQTLELLNKLMQIEEFKTLRLVGGTSLALQIGHRQSIDLDLFGKLEIDEIELSEILHKAGSITVLKKTKNINIYLIDAVKVDLVNYPYAWLDETYIKDNIRLAGLRDIAAMKLAAITGRGTKKDFIDLFFLLQKYKLGEMLEFYKLKYYDASEILVLKSLAYFDDADAEEEPKMFEKINWTEVKGVITDHIKQYLSNL